jgi:hypothetical protein
LTASNELYLFSASFSAFAGWKVSLFGSGNLDGRTRRAAGRGAVIEKTELMT